jgi:hypothetical protein
VITWLLSFLPAPVRGILLLTGVVAYVVSIFATGPLQSIMQLIAGITGASGIFATAKSAQVTGTTQAALSEEAATAPTSSPATDQKVDGHSQEAADDYQRNIFNP